MIEDVMTTNTKNKTVVNVIRDVADAFREQRRPEERRRFVLGSQMMALGNLAAAVLLFGHAYSGFPFDFRVALLGLLTLAFLYAWALKIMKGGGW